ncbi:MAG: hypothetical protein QOG80_1061 [Pseudonocardiales bacterium]|nr:hypothetical protein [Pseudonocardiales bacterium]
MVLIAGVCVLLGTWQIARLGQKVTANDDLRRNAHAAAVPVSAVLPLVGNRKAPKTHAIQFRSVTATGTFDVAHQTLARLRTVNGDTGDYVVTPLRTSGGVLLVARGFVTSTTVTSPPAPPSGQVTVTARVEPGDTRHDDAGQLPGHQVESINPPEQAARLGTPVYNGYAELLDGQPGVGTMTPIPAPDLSNPAGGAVEPQHVAYIIQWYLFAALALAAPLAMARSETKHRDERDFDEVAAEPAPASTSAPTPEQARAARLADRYGKAVR